MDKCYSSTSNRWWYYYHTCPVTGVPGTCTTLLMRYYISCSKTKKVKTFRTRSCIIFMCGYGTAIFFFYSSTLVCTVQTCTLTITSSRHPFCPSSFSFVSRHPFPGLHDSRYRSRSKRNCTALLVAVLFFLKHDFFCC